MISISSKLYVYSYYWKYRNKTTTACKFVLYITKWYKPNNDIACTISEDIKIGN